MNKVAQEYRESLAVLTERLRQGNSNLDELIAGRRSQLLVRDDMTEQEIDQALAQCAVIWRVCTQLHRCGRTAGGLTVYAHHPRERLERAGGYHR